MKHPRPTQPNSRAGFSMGIVMVIFVIVALMGTGLVQLSGINAVEAAKGVSSSQAFWFAEAGLEEARTLGRIRVEKGESELFPAGSRTWSHAFSGGGSYSVSITRDINLFNPTYTVTSEGTAPGGAVTAVKATMGLASPITVGLMGLDSLVTRANISIASYYSSTNINTVTNEAVVGSNGSISLGNNVQVAGHVAVGAEVDGTPATVSGNSAGNDLIDYGHIDPDPLGAADGWLAGEFDAARLSNNNTAAGISGNRLADHKNGKDTTTLTAGRYYLTYLEINGELEVDARDGRVEIFLSGEMDTKPGTEINVQGKPTDFRIYSNSTEPIRLMPNGDFRGFIYAPFSSELRIQPGGDLYGAFWAENTVLQPGGTVWMDMDLLSASAFETYRVVTSDWQEEGRMW